MGQPIFRRFMGVHILDISWITFSTVSPKRKSSACKWQPAPSWILRRDIMILYPGATSLRVSKRVLRRHRAPSSEALAHVSPSVLSTLRTAYVTSESSTCGMAQPIHSPDRSIAMSIQHSSLCFAPSRAPRWWSHWSLQRREFGFPPQPGWVEGDASRRQLQQLGGIRSCIQQHALVREYPGCILRFHR